MIVIYSYTGFRVAYRNDFRSRGEEPLPILCSADKWGNISTKKN